MLECRLALVLELLCASILLEGHVSKTTGRVLQPHLVVQLPEVSREELPAVLVRQDEFWMLFHELGNHLLHPCWYTKPLLMRVAFYWVVMSNSSCLRP